MVLNKCELTACLCRDAQGQPHCMAAQWRSPLVDSSSELQDVLERHILPQLFARDLGRLAASCQAVRLWLTAADPASWSAAAAKHLPASYPKPALASTAEARRTLQCYATAQRNVRAGSPISSFRRPGYASLSWSPREPVHAACRHSPASQAVEIMSALDGQVHQRFSSG